MQGFDLKLKPGTPPRLSEHNDQEAARVDHVIFQQGAPRR
jgi:hypothetical protein